MSQLNHQQTQQTDGAFDTNMLISLLLEQMLLETLKGRASIPMAALCKRLGLRMSTLQRHLTLLESHDLVTVHCDDAGRWTTTLTAQGQTIAISLSPPLKLAS